MKIIAASAHQKAAEGQNIIELPNDADPLALDLTGVTRIDLHFPKFSDGRAFSQARLLRQRCKFTGEIRATGDVLIDQLVQMARCGFDVAVLREGVDLADAQRQFDRFSAFYQGDALQPQPHFARPA
ncbi:DUF934 domain-containing protein [Simplicispira lacusdiani]|uniref:DUF934 domain-containing protein n=1 Tax=Simplicispira lacusdiani TaxID=2213010 RepID=UPI000E74938F|nr:DUF934 domain-containing protein [Simplicispira lacusdiani]